MPGVRVARLGHAIASSGRGTVYSYAVHHYPPIPGFDVPNLVGLVELEEGTRVLANLIGVDPDDVEIGMPVEVYFEDFEAMSSCRSSGRCA